jgi:hypothetical protein
MRKLWSVLALVAVLAAVGGSVFDAPPAFDDAPAFALCSSTPC